jgi:hypothetical protein
MSLFAKTFFAKTFFAKSLFAKSPSSCLKAIGLVAVILAGPIAAARAEIVTTRSQIDAGVKPWPAPTGHRQPHVVDVAPDPRQQADRSDDLLELEIDRKLRICRGC